MELLPFAVAVVEQDLVAGGVVGAANGAVYTAHRADQFSALVPEQACHFVGGVCGGDEAVIGVVPVECGAVDGIGDADQPLGGVVGEPCAVVVLDRLMVHNTQSRVSKMLLMMGGRLGFAGRRWPRVLPLGFRCWIK